MAEFSGHIFLGGKVGERDLDVLALQIARRWGIPVGPKPPDAPDGPQRAVKKRAEVTTWKDPKTGIVYQRRDAALAGILRASASSARTGFVTPPKSKGIR